MVKVRVTQIRLPTKNNTLHEVKITETNQPVSLRKPNTSVQEGGGICYVDENVTFDYATENLNGRAWLFNCTGEAACSAHALTQVYDSYAQDWQTVEGGAVTSGCSESDASRAGPTPCLSIKTQDVYRTRGIYTVVWADGDTSEGGPFYSGTTGLSWLCSPSE
jgi:hypothetical protein